eukprot:s2769_g17.t1
MAPPLDSRNSFDLQKALGEALKTNSTLASINLGGNRIRDEPGGLQERMLGCNGLEMLSAVRQNEHVRAWQLISPTNSRLSAKRCRPLHRSPAIGEAQLHAHQHQPRTQQHQRAGGRGDETQVNP